jgi:hypothetical protein
LRVLADDRPEGVFGGWLEVPEAGEAVKLVEFGEGAAGAGEGLVPEVAVEAGVVAGGGAGVVATDRGERAVVGGRG